MRKGATLTDRLETLVDMCYGFAKIGEFAGGGGEEGARGLGAIVVAIGRRRERRRPVGWIRGRAGWRLPALKVARILPRMGRRVREATHGGDAGGGSSGKAVRGA